MVAGRGEGGKQKVNAVLGPPWRGEKGYEVPCGSQ